MRCGRSAARPNVLFITLDTTRYDRLGCYGYDRDTTPRLDELASSSTRYETAIASSSWTLPSHATLFTGKFATSHGARYDPEGPLKLTDAIAGPKSFDDYRARGLAANERTLAQMLSEADYRTGAVVGGPWMRRAFGLDKGFQLYDDEDIDSVNGRRASDVTRAALAWLDDTEDDDKPYFLFLNYYDAHAPYDPPEPYRSAFASTSEPSPEELYDGEIAYMDFHLGRVLDAVDLDRTLVIVTADHGELFGEHGHVGHGNYLYQEEIRVPFIVKVPGVEPSTTTEPAHHVDVTPLVLAHTGLAPNRIRVERPLIAEVSPLPFSSEHGSWRALIARGYKLLANDQGRDQLYNLMSDPGESVNLIGKEPERAQAMMRFLESYLDALPPPGDAGPPRELDPSTRDALRSLGYVP